MQSSSLRFEQSFCSDTKAKQTAPIPEEIITLTMHRDQIVKEHLEPLFRFAWALCGSDSAAVELTQQVLAEDCWSEHGENVRATRIDLFTTAYRCFTGDEALPIPTAHDRVGLIGHESLQYADCLTSRSLLKSFRELELPQRAALVLFYTTQCLYPRNSNNFASFQR